ncbi:MAG TPA: Brp/Blh family beta-carotene 15,15'-dioxygenase [Candidatus Competibacter sp.]|nr:Brp/Blh family beta-carotene 15,15'-dioxygenase [Candidatus Competibacter sp.]
MIDRRDSRFSIALRQPMRLSLIYLMLTSIGGLGFNTLSITLDARLHWFGLLLSIALFGLPHGALDPLLAYRARLFQRPLGAGCFILVYLALVGAMLWFWRWQPDTALAVFLTITAWHFSSDWRQRGHPIIGWLSVALLLGLPALTHPQPLVGLFELLDMGTAKVFQIGLASVGALALALTPFVAIRVFRDAPEAALELVAIAAGGFLLPPLWFFSLYFCVLHSPRHLLRYFSDAMKTPSRGLLLTGITFSLPVVATVVWMLAGLSREETVETSARIVFAGLFALTVPHVLVVEWFERRALVL